MPPLRSTQSIALNFSYELRFRNCCPTVLAEAEIGHHQSGGRDRFPLLENPLATCQPVLSLKQRYFLLHAMKADH
jgi:hypothetical protein